VLLQRLFSAFPDNWPGTGLLLQRAVIAAFLFRSGVKHPVEVMQFGLVNPQLIQAGVGMFLLLGLWTPICGTIIAVVEVWIAFSSDCDSGISIMLAAFGVTLAMIGPGAWSLDAHLFGRKHFKMPQR
jgi:putative oxidoreductase